MNGNMNEGKHKNLTLRRLCDLYHSESWSNVPRASNGEIPDIMKIRLLTDDLFGKNTTVFFNFTTGGCYATKDCIGPLGGISPSTTLFDILPTYSLGDLYLR